MHVTFTISLKTPADMMVLNDMIICLLLSSGSQPVSLLIGASSSTTGIILSRILGPLSVPVVSFITLGVELLMSLF